MGTGWRDVVVVVDVGTSGARAAAVRLDGVRRLEIRRPFRTSFPRSGWVEQSAHDWRRASISALAALVRRLGDRDVLAIGLTGQSPSVVLIDDRGRPVSAGLTYQDNRSTSEAQELRRRYGDAAIHSRTGHVPSAFHIAPKLMWLATHEPESMAAAALALQPRDWVAMTLTGDAWTDGTHAASTLLYDLRAHRWDESLASDIGIARSLLPPIARSHEVIGRLRPAIAKRIGLPATTPVVLGAADSQACALGAGVIAPGPASEMAGSSSCLNAAVKVPLTTLEITHFPHAIDGVFTTETGINTAGTAIVWVADRFYGGRAGRARASDFETLDREATSVEPGSDGVLALPVFADGERHDPGMRGAITGLSLRHHRATIARAMMEGVAHRLADGLELLAAAGQPVRELRVSGGDTRLTTWNQIKADVLGVPVKIVPGDATVSGIAMLAGLGVGAYAGVDAAVARCVRFGHEFEPQPSRVSVYQAARVMYRDLARSNLVKR